MVRFSCPKPNFRFKMTSLRISGLENSFNWHHQTTSMLWMQFGVVWLLQSVLNNLMLLMKQWPNWEKILIRLVKFFSKIEILTRVLFEIRTTEAICQNVHEILHLRLKFKRNSYISLTGAISMIWFIFQLDVMDLQVPFNCSNNELGCCIGPFSSFSMDWHVVKSFWSSFSSITLTILMLFKLWHHGFFGKFPATFLEIEILIFVDIWLLLSFFPSTQENENQSNVIWSKLSNKKNMLTRIPSLNSFFGKPRRPIHFFGGKIQIPKRFHPTNTNFYPKMGWKSVKNCFWVKNLTILPQKSAIFGTITFEIISI